MPMVFSQGAENANGKQASAASPAAVAAPLSAARFSAARFSAVRFSTVRLRENAERVAFYGGEGRAGDVVPNAHAGGVPPQAPRHGDVHATAQFESATLVHRFSLPLGSSKSFIHCGPPAPHAISPQL